MRLYCNWRMERSFFSLSDASYLFEGEDVPEGPLNKSVQDIYLDMVSQTKSSPHEESVQLPLANASQNPSIDTTPAKLASTPARLMAATPALSTPKRCYMSPEDSSNSTPDKWVRHSPRTQSRMKRHGSSSALLSLQIRAKEENDPAISQARKRREIIAALPKLLDTFHFMCTSSRSTGFTKQELMHKVIGSRLDMIDDKGQLDMMKELVPEWISEKSVCGFSLVYVNGMSDPNTIRKKLAEAK